MSVPDAALTFLLDNISKILVYHYGLIANASENVSALSESLEDLRTQMHYFQKYGHDEAYVKRTIKKMRGVIAEAEDAVETYLLQQIVRDSKNWIRRGFKKITDVGNITDMAEQINKLAAEVKKVQAEGTQNTMVVLQHQAMLDNPPQSKEAPKVEEDHVIGLDEAAAAVKQLLTEVPQHLEIVSIVGMLGLGKTTLARKVFNDPDMDAQFIITAFVYVSKDFDRKEVFLQILKSFTETEDLKEKTADELEKYLCKTLQGKKYLIVMDDVWEIEHWKKLRDAFPKNNKLCRVLITTRHEIVARYANEKGSSHYYLALLDEEKSRELFRWRVYGERSFPDEMQEFEREILKRCDGLPLAIVVIAGIIWSQRDEISKWKVVAGSVSNLFATNKEETGKVIEIMYKHLPNYLKPCFLYLGVFREDSEIPVWKLVRLWIAEGLIVDEVASNNLEDMAESYLNDLVSRNLVIVERRTSTNTIKTCRMHDTLREFCKKEAAEENMFHEIKQQNSSFSLPGNASWNDARRLCLNNADIIRYMSQQLPGKCVRSFLTFVKEETPVEPGLVTCLPKTFKLLRVLEVQALLFTRLPSELYNVVLLKYLAISCELDSLPDGLSKLKFMQTLIVHTTEDHLKINADIWSMPQFRHLHTNASTTLPAPKSHGKKGKEEVAGENVQTLSTISPKSCTKELFDTTPNLRKLGICGDLTKLINAKGESSLFQHLRRLRFLENLKLLNGDEDSKLSSLPLEGMFPQKLMKLTLKNTQLNWDQMVRLGELHCLQVLKLREHAFQGTCWVTNKGGFFSLKHLYIGRMDLVEWETASVDHFPALRSLKLDGCGKLNVVPNGLETIPSFQTLVLYSTNTRVASSARKLQELKRSQAKEEGKKNSFSLSIYPPQH